MGLITSGMQSLLPFPPIPSVLSTSHLPFGASLFFSSLIDSLANQIPRLAGKRSLFLPLGMLFADTLCRELEFANSLRFIDDRAFVTVLIPVVSSVCPTHFCGRQDTVEDACGGALIRDLG
jgi:hypothetical protein